MIELVSGMPAPQFEDEYLSNKMICRALFEIYCSTSEIHVETNYPR
jgi:hypothetical protein